MKHYYFYIFSGHILAAVAVAVAEGDVVTLCKATLCSNTHIHSDVLHVRSVVRFAACRKLEILLQIS